MSFPLFEAYQPLVRFDYTCFDRLVIRGYVGLLQQPGGLVTWARRLIPGEPITESWLTSFARRFHKGGQKYAAQRGIDIIPSPKGQRKQDVAEQFRRRRQPDSGVYLIIQARERAFGFESIEPKDPTNSIYRKILKRQRYVDHFYFYLVDKYWGPICLKICSHPPFQVIVFLNGNRWLAREAEHRGLEVTTRDNSIVQCSDPKALQEISDTLDCSRLQAVCEYWGYRLLPVLTREQRIDSGFHYQWSFIQAEMSHNLVFRNPLRLTEVLERHIDLNRRHLQPCSLQTPARRRYQATEEGLRVAALLTKLKDSLLEPMLKGGRKGRRRQQTELPAPDCFYQGIERLLGDLCAFLGIQAAA